MGEFLNLCSTLVIHRSRCLILDFSLGSYEICEAEGVKRGTKVVIHLKGDAQEFAKEETIKGL